MSFQGMQHGARHFVAYNQQLIIRLSVIVGLPLIAVMTGQLIAYGTVDTPMLLAAIVAPIGILVFFRLGRFEYGIIAVAIAAGMINFFTLPTGTDSRIVVSLLLSAVLVGGWVLQSLVVQKRFRLIPSPINRPVLAFAAVNIISYVWSIIFRDPIVFVWRSFPIVQLAALAVNILLPVLTLLIANKVKEIKWLRWLTWIMIGMGAFVVVSLLFGLPTDVFFANGSSGLFGMWVVALAYALALFDDSLDWRIRTLLLLLVGAWIFKNFIQSRIWVSGWLPMGIACVMITYLRSRKLFVVALALGLVYIGANFDELYRTTIVANEEEGSEQRIGLWETNLHHVANHPLFGMGPAGYAVYNMTYNPEDARSTHNNYFDILAQTGIVGFGVFIWLLASFVRLGRRTRQALAGRHNFEEAFAAAALAGIVAAIAAMMLGDWVIPFAYNSTITGFDHSAFTWLLAGGMVSLSLITLSRQHISSAGGHQA